MKFYLPLLTRHHRERSGTPVFENSHLSTSFSFPRSPSAGCGGSRVSQWISSWSPETEEEKKIIIPSHVMVGASLIALLVKNPPAMQETLVRFLGQEDPLRRERLPIPVSCPGEFHGLYSPWGHKELDRTE